jgi:hypothetical protein
MLAGCGEDARYGEVVLPDQVGQRHDGVNAAEHLYAEWLEKLRQGSQVGQRGTRAAGTSRAAASAGLR